MDTGWALKGLRDAGISYIKHPFVLGLSKAVTTLVRAILNVDLNHYKARKVLNVVY